MGYWREALIRHSARRPTYNRGPYEQHQAPVEERFGRLFDGPNSSTAISGG